MKFFFHFHFRFLLTRDIRWVTERIQSPIQNLESIENEKENGKKNYVATFCRKSFMDSKTVFVFILSSIKTEGVLFFFIYIHIYIYLYIYKKLSPKWKNIQEQQVFFFLFYILCENFSKIGPIIKKIPKFSDDPLKMDWCDISNALLSVF